MKKIGIYHNKGGVGKTTVATNLAAAISKQGKRVLLIDIDAQANATFATGLVKFQHDDDDDLKDRNVFHLLGSGEYDFIPDIVRKSQGFSNPEIDVIPSHITLVEKESDLTRFAHTRSRLNLKLEKVKGNYDFVIIDAPPSRDIYAEITLVTADYLIIPSDLRPFANQGLPNVEKFLKDVNETRQSQMKSPIQVLGVLPSKIPTNSKYLEHTFPRQKALVPNRYNFSLMETTIFERTVLSDCFNKTLPLGRIDIPAPKSIFEFKGKNPSDIQKSQEDFKKLASEVLNQMETVQ